MSTKAIRITLEWVKEQLEDSLDRPFSRAQTKLDEGRLKRLKEALSEVEAIERSAKAISALGGLPAYKTGLSRADEIGIGMHMADIAKDAP